MGLRTVEEYRAGLRDGRRVFEDVFVPWERVFLCGEWHFAGRLAMAFATFHRYTAVSDKPPLGEICSGTAALAAEYHGLEQAATLRGKIARLAMYPALIRAARLAAASECRFAAGIAVPNGVYSNVRSARRSRARAPS
jgi:4-hydroxyphenylacetate 3-monooxygenase/4-hydroxybutyryl-CoA dehydratase/vinylacetyl-CoA-Delta-isomerase